MVAALIASMRMLPSECVTTPSFALPGAPSAFRMYASTTLLISLRASPSPTDTATPAAPNPAATDAEPALAPIVERSSAVSVMSRALMPVAPSPSIKAFTSVAIRFSVSEPAPLAATPTVPPATATEPVSTLALMVSRAVAFICRSPPAAMLESRT